MIQADAQGRPDSFLCEESTPKDMESVSELGQQVNGGGLLALRKAARAKRKESRERNPLKREEWQHIDIATPPAGCVASVLEFMRSREIRSIGDAAPVGDALQIISMLSGRYTTFDGFKLGLITMVIGLTGSGKNNGQAVARRVMSHIGKSRFISSNVTSQKGTAQSLIRNDGRAFYVVDEAHGFFNAANKKGADAYIEQAVAQMLSLFTDEVYIIRDQEQKEVIKMIEDAKKKRDIELRAAGKSVDDVLSVSDIIKAQKSSGAIPLPYDPATVDPKSLLSELMVEIDKLERILNHGIESPQFNAMFYSTPDELDKAISVKSVNSGLTGRTLMFRAPEHRERKNRERLRNGLPKIEVISEMVTKLGQVENIDITISEAGRDMLDEVDDLLEERINDHTLGAVYTRGYELICKVAALVSIQYVQGRGQSYSIAAKIEPEHVLYAFKLFLHSLSNIRNLLATGDADTSFEGYFLGRANQISAGKWVSHSSMTEKLSRSKKDKDRLIRYQMMIDSNRGESSKEVDRAPRAIAERVLQYLANENRISSKTGQRGGILYKRKGD